MRMVLGAVWVGLLGCAAPADDTDKNPYCGNGHSDPGEECDSPGVGDCSDQCTLPPVTVTVHWVFSTLDGSAQSSCLPGNPEVVVHVGQARHPALCEDGALTFSIRVTDLVDSALSISCDADHEYVGYGGFVVGAGDLSPIVLYTDVGDLGVGWTLVRSYGAPTNCSPGDTVELSLDGAIVTTVPCAGDARLSKVPIGTHTLLAKGLDAQGTVMATADPIDVTILASTTVGASFVLTQL